jgi:hypothetical protein
MQRTAPKPWPLPRHSSLFYETHPTFGYYVYSGDHWSQLRARPDGREVMLRCWERSPSDARLRQWDEIDARLLELERIAIAAVPQPPAKAARSQFRPDELSLCEISIDVDGTFALFFNTPTGDEIQLWPIVTFSFDGWSIREAEWAT